MAALCVLSRVSRLNELERSGGMCFLHLSRARALPLDLGGNCRSWSFTTWPFQGTPALWPLPQLWKSKGVLSGMTCFPTIEARMPLAVVLLHPLIAWGLLSLEILTLSLICLFLTSLRESFMMSCWFRFLKKISHRQRKYFLSLFLLSLPQLGLYHLPPGQHLTYHHSSIQQTQPADQPSDCVKNIWLELSQNYLFTCCLWMLLCYNGRIELLQQRPHGRQA